VSSIKFLDLIYYFEQLVTPFYTLMAQNKWKYSKRRWESLL